MAEHEVVLGFAAEIISAHISNNTVRADQLPGLIQQVFNTLSTIEQISVPPLQPTAAAVPVKKSVRSDRIICLDCGRHFSMIKRHLMADHRLTPQQYRQRWDLPPSYPLVAPAYAKVRSELAMRWGLGRKVMAERKMAREPLAEDVARSRYNCAIELPLDRLAAAPQCQPDPEFLTNTGRDAGPGITLDCP